MLLRAARRRCPRCGARHIFRTYFSLHERCPQCGYRFEREEGFFTGVYLLNFGFTAVVLFGLVMVGALWVGIRNGGVPVVPTIIVGEVLAVLLPIVLYPFARSTWAAIDLIMRPLDPVEEAEAAIHATDLP
jgi:uncharacterized protein (DUF983 family)